MIQGVFSKLTFCFWAMHCIVIATYFCMFFGNLIFLGDLIFFGVKMIFVVLWIVVPNMFWRHKILADLIFWET